MISVKKLTLPTLNRYVVLLFISYQQSCLHGKLLISCIYTYFDRFSDFCSTIATCCMNQVAREVWDVN